MNLEETTNIKKRIDDVLEAANRYEESSKQLAKVKNNIDKYVAAAEESNKKLIDLSSSVEKLVEEGTNFQKGLGEKISDFIAPEIDALKNCIKTSQNDYQELNEKSHAIINALEQYKQNLANQYTELNSALSDISSTVIQQDKEISEITTNLNSRIEQVVSKAEEKLGKTIDYTETSMKNAALEVKEQLQSKEYSRELSRMIEQIVKEELSKQLGDLKQEIIAKGCDSIKEDNKEKFNNIENSIEEIKKKMKDNQDVILVALAEIKKNSVKKKGWF